MLRSNVTKSLCTLGVGFFAAHAGIAQEVKNLAAGARRLIYLFSHWRL